MGKNNFAYVSPTNFSGNPGLKVIFCRQDEKPDFSKSPNIFLNTWKSNSAFIGKNGVCVLEKIGICR
jgi:hypothetical protein